MPGLILLPVVLVLALHMAAVCLSRALRTYSRTQLEALCQACGVPARADDVARHDERTERSAEALAVLTGLGLAAFLGVASDRLAPALAAEAVVAIALGVAGLGYVVAGVLGRVYAEAVLVRIWPVAAGLRFVMTPATGLMRRLEAYAYNHSPQHAASPRPASVEVEVFDTESSEEEAFEADLPDETRTILERAVVLARRDVADVMTPRSSMTILPANVSAADAARAFIESGFSRIPLFGEHREDIIGILFAKDLFADMFGAGTPRAACPRKLARPPLFVPETKSATELLNEFRLQRNQMAIVLDEYGTVTGLVTLEDLLEGLVGEIDDEHDRPSGADPIVAVGAARFEVEASVTIAELNERLGLHLATDADYETLGGLAFTTFGRIPETGESFRHEGIAFTVLSVGPRTIRRLLLDLQPEAVPGAAGPAGNARG